MCTSFAGCLLLLLLLLLLELKHIYSRGSVRGWRTIYNIYIYYIYIIYMGFSMSPIRLGEVESIPCYLEPNQRCSMHGAPPQMLVRDPDMGRNVSTAPLFAPQPKARERTLGRRRAAVTAWIPSWGRYRLGLTSIASCCRSLRNSSWGFPPYLAPKSSLASRWPDATESGVGIAQQMGRGINRQARDGMDSCTACERDAV